MTSRAFVFTWNNPPYKVHQEADVESQDWKDPPYGWPSVKYAVWQYELFIESSGQYGQPLGGPPPTMKERIRRAWETDEDHNDKE